MLPDLSERVVEPEVMDQPGLDDAAHRAALRGLARINAVSRSAALLWPSLAAAWEAKRSAGPPHAGSAAPVLRVLDVACGGGDVAIDLWKRARRLNVRLALTAIDVSQTAVEQARDAARHAGAGIDVVRLDALRDPLPSGFDVAVTSLFIHHLSRDEAVRVLRKMAEAAPRVVVNDLERTRAGYVAARIGTRMLSRSPVVHVDGPRSVRAALTREELRSIAEGAGLREPRVVRRWPFRLLLDWERR